MSQESLVALVIFGAGWFIWVTSSIFAHRQSIALLKLEISVLSDVRGLLSKISTRLEGGRRG